MDNEKRLCGLYMRVSTISPGVSINYVKETISI